MPDLADPDRLGRIGDLVERNADRARALRAVAGDVVEDPELAAARLAGIAEARDQAWRRIVPQRFHGVTVDDVEPHARAQLDEWAARPAGRNLVIHGPVGSGKSSAALLACRHAHDAGLDVAFWPVAELLDALRPSAPEPVDLGELAALDRLILDDVGAERPTDWTAERFGIVVNRRWMEEAPTVATTNLEGRTLRDRLGERTYSRLCRGAVIVRLSGRDRRLAR